MASLRSIIVAGLAFGTAFAFPAPEARPEPARCEDYGECEQVQVGRYLVNTLVAPRNATLYPRQDDIKTNINPGQGQVHQRLVSQTEAPGDSAFGQLWDQIGDICFGTTCNFNDMTSVTVGSYTFQLSAQADVTTEDNLHQFIDLLRACFFTSLVQEDSTEETQQPGAPSQPPTTIVQQVRDYRGLDFLNAQLFGGEYSGQTMSVSITVVENMNGCPAAVEAISAAAGSLPGAGAFFGLISASCAAQG